MSLAALISSNKQWGGYSRAGSRWVSDPRGRGELGNFLGLGGSMLAARSSRPGRIGAPIRPNLGHAESMTYGRSASVVAQPVVAALVKSAGDQGVGMRRRLIANLTTRGRLELTAAWARAASAPIGRGGFPLSRAPACPQTPRAGAIRDLENFRPDPVCPERRSTVGKNREVHDWQLGSGVDFGANGAGSGAQRAESGRIKAGRGGRGDHPSLDAGRVAMLLAASAQVNGNSKKIPAR